MLKTCYYARVSTEEEKQSSAFISQIEDLETFIQSKPDWILVDKYRDEGKSGTTTKGRNEYNRLYEDIATDKWDILVIKDQSRLMRNVLDWYLFLNKMMTHEKKLFLYIENTFYTPDNALITGIKAMMAEEYSRDLSKRINSSAKRSQKNGTVYGNGKLWGYNQVKGKLEINEEEANVVRMVFDFYIEGMGFRKIAQKLEELNIRSSKGTPFPITTLKRMIRQEKYKGTLICNKRNKDFETKKINNVPESQWIIHEDVVPVIIEKEKWEQANNILNKKKKDYGIDEKAKIFGYFSGSYVLSNKIKCGKCGRPYWHSGYAKTVNKKDVWQCKGYRAFGKNGVNGCDNKTLYTESTTNLIKDVIFDFWGNKDESLQGVIEILNKITKSNNIEKELKGLISKKQKAEQRIDKLLDILLDGSISKEIYNNKKIKLEEELNYIEKSINILNEESSNRKTKIERLNNIQNKLSESIKSKEDIGDEIISFMLDKIIVYEDYIDVILCGEDNNINTKIEIKMNGKDFIYPNVTNIILYRTLKDKKYQTKTKNIINTINVYIAI